MNPDNVDAARDAAERRLGHGVDPAGARPAPGLLVPGIIVEREHPIVRFADQALDIDRFPAAAAGRGVFDVVHVSPDNAVAVLEGEAEELRQVMVIVGEYLAGAFLKVHAFADVALDAGLGAAGVDDSELEYSREVLQLFGGRLVLLANERTSERANERTNERTSLSAAARLRIGPIGPATAFT